MTVDRVHNFLTRNGYSARALHGDIPQNKDLKQWDSSSAEIFVCW